MQKAGGVLGSSHLSGRLQEPADTPTKPASEWAKGIVTSTQMRQLGPSPEVVGPIMFRPASWPLQCHLS